MRRPTSAFSIRRAQGVKFDPDGAYVRRYVPELARLPNDAYSRARAGAEQTFFSAAGIALGKDYPRPIVDHASARTRALEAYGAVKRARELDFQRSEI